MSIFSGVVVSGRGIARGHISNSLGELSAITRVELYPGSLNVVLDKPVNLDSSCAATFDDDRRYIWEARIGTHQVWLYRWKGAPFNIVEILADCKLRETLGLLNGSRVDIVINDDMVVPMSFFSHLVFLVLWGGRKHMFYSDTYESKTKFKYLRRRMGDGQM